MIEPIPLHRCRHEIGSILLGAVLLSAVGHCAAPVSAEETASRNELRVAIGQSDVIETGWPVKRVSVANEKVADVYPLATDRILVIGKSTGTTDIFAWGEEDEVWRARVSVIPDLEALEDSLEQSLPGARLDLSQPGEVLIVSGTLASAEQARGMHEILEAAGRQYADMTRVAGIQQVQIEVRVAEVSRNAIRALGFNAFQVGEDAFGALQIGSAGGGPLNQVPLGVPEDALALPGLPFSFIEDVTPSPAVTLFGGLTEHDVMVFVQALSENQYLRILAEPTLVALNGEEASFLAGGEFPIPVVQGGTAQSTSITIEYKEFGVRLSFRPTVLGESKIRLRVAPEVSELTDTGAVTIQGFRVPGLLTRRAETTLELQSGQTFAMAGLLSSRRGERISRVPLLGDLPILGPLFRSVRYEEGETELVVLATASLVEPLDVGTSPPFPGSVDDADNDWEFFLKGRTAAAASDLAPLPFAELSAPPGLARLRGPGAWTDHSRGIARGRAARRQSARSSLRDS